MRPAQVHGVGQECDNLSKGNGMTTPQPPTSQNAATTARVEAREASGAGWYVGQTVRCVDPFASRFGNSLSKGETYTVERIVNDSQLGVFLHIADFGVAFCETRFEPVEAPNVPTP